MFLWNIESLLYIQQEEVLVMNTVGQDNVKKKKQKKKKQLIELILKGKYKGFNSTKYLRALQ